MNDKPSIYLDYAAATPLDDEVLLAMTPFFKQDFYNPSATYLPAKRAKASLDMARTKVAEVLGSKPTEIVFTSGASEANNLAVQGIMNRFEGSNVVISSIEHESVIAPASLYENRLVNVGPDGRIDMDDLKSKIDENTVLVSIMLANNEVGTIEPIKDIAQVLKEERSRRHINAKPIYLHTDATQAANYLDLHVSRLGVDLMSLNGGKIHGPKQTGCLFIKTGIELQPLIYGGGQERNIRSGTENVSGSIGFSAALVKVQSNKQEESKRLKDLQQQLINELKVKFENIEINGSTKYRLPNNIHITFSGVDNERLLIQLDELGIQAAAGSACSASSDEPSHVLTALGKTTQQAQSSIRFSMGQQTQKSDIDYLVASLENCVN
jgi:cysteine desulfurase